MVFVKFQFIDRSGIPITIRVIETFSIGDILDYFFPNNKNFAIYLKVENTNKCQIISRESIIKDLLKRGILSENKYIYYLVDKSEFITVYINECTREFIKSQKKYTLYCTSDTTVSDIEKELETKFHCGKDVIGLYGCLEDNKVIKLKEHENVLFVKSCFKRSNFFQVQFINEREVLRSLKSSFEGRFYLLKTSNDILIFKRMNIFSLRETTLVQLKGNKISKCFFNIHEANISLDRLYGKHMISICDEEKIWILCNYDEMICEQMYFTLLSCKSKKSLRIIECEENENIEDSNKSVLVSAMNSLFNDEQPECSINIPSGEPNEIYNNSNINFSQDAILVSEKIKSSESTIEKSINPSEILLSSIVLEKESENEVIYDSLLDRYFNDDLNIGDSKEETLSILENKHLKPFKNKIFKNVFLSDDDLISSEHNDKFIKYLDEKESINNFQIKNRIRVFKEDL